MGLMSRVIRSLINGISQQAPSVRLDNQVESQLNMIPDISGVLTRRSPVSLDDIIVQDGSRDYSEEHAMFTMTIEEQKIALGIKPDGSVYRFDVDFSDSIISQAESVKTYLAHTDKNDISVVETSDSLLILNRNKTVALNTSPSPTTADERRGLIWVTSAFENATYKVFKFDAVGSKTTVGETVGQSSDTPKSIINKLVNGGTGSVTNMNTAITSTKTFHIENNTVIVRDDDLSYFEVECDYGNHIQTITEAESDNTKTITNPSSLPAKIATGVADTLTPITNENFLVRVNPDVNEPLNTYYLRYSSDYDAWVEVSDPYIDSIDNTTMPVRIPKNTLATITVEHSPFLPPSSGDNQSNPSPTIVGGKIRDMLIYNSRLGFATANTLVFSAIDDYYSLYRATTSSYLISDPVDLELDSSKLGYKTISNIFSIDNNIIVNTGLSQSLLAVPNTLDISKAIFAQVSTFDLGDNIPMPIRRSMYFPIKSGSFTTIKAFAPDSQSNSGFTDNPVTKHCEKYIRGEVVQSVFSQDVFLARTDDDPKTLYVQHTYVSEGTILQNAWHKWTFKYDIKFIYSVGDQLKLIFEDTDNTQTIYGTMEINASEIAEDIPTQIGYFPYLDFYTSDTDLADLLSGTISIDTNLGKIVPAGSANSIQGNTYVSSVTLSEIIPRTQGQDGVMTKIGYSILMLRRMSITLGYSGRFKVLISRTRRSTYTHNFIPELLGTIIIGREPVNVRNANFPINGRSQDISIRITTEDTFTPLQIRSAEWQGQIISQGGR